MKQSLLIVLVLISIVSCKNDETKKLGQKNETHHYAPKKDIIFLKQINTTSIAYNSTFEYHKQFNFSNYKIELISSELNIYARIYRKEKLIQDIVSINHQIDFFDEEQIEVFKSDSDQYYVILPSISDETEIINYISIFNENIEVSEYYTSDREKYYDFLKTGGEIYEKHIVLKGDTTYMALKNQKILLLNKTYDLNIDAKALRIELSTIKKEVEKKTDYLSEEWNGVYLFYLELDKMGESHSISLKIQVNQSPILTYKIDNNPSDVKKGYTISKLTKDSLVLTNYQNKVSYFITKNKEDTYFISGSEILKLNPPNKEYQIEKL